jgi:hypothetical protein
MLWAAPLPRTVVVQTDQNSVYVLRALDGGGDGPLLVLRLRDSPAGPTSIYDVDPVTGRSSLIGEVDDALLNLPYELVGRHIVRMREGRLQVMAVG